MKVKVGTFNLNNLFSRFNFAAQLSELKEYKIDGDIEYRFTKGEVIRLRTYQGKLVKPKDEEQIKKITDRIKEMNLDVLAVQEVEDIDTLRNFNKDNLGSLYKYEVLHEGNDPRLIDVGLLSKYPVGEITSWQFATHPSKPEERIFGRDLLEVEILDNSRAKVILKVFNNHLKSQFANYWEDQDEAKQKNDERRLRQTETLVKILKSETTPSDPFIILGDMNASPDSDTLIPLTKDKDLGLINALENPGETSTLKISENPPLSCAWTHRFKDSGVPAKYELFDQIWLGPKLGGCLKAAWIHRRKKLGGDGSDHDPSWVELNI